MGLITFFSVLALDQLSKFFLVSNLGLGQSHFVTPFFNFVHARNHGVSFSMLAQYDIRWGLTILATSIAAYIAWLWSRTRHTWQSITYGAIVGGAVGNIIDRIVRGSVVDFLYFHIGPYGYPAFNIADSAIVCGVAWLLWKGWHDKNQFT